MSNDTVNPADAVGSSEGLGQPAKPCDCMEQVNKKLMERGFVVVMRWPAA